MRERGGAREGKEEEGREIERVRTKGETERREREERGKGGGREQRHNRHVREEGEEGRARLRT